MKTLLKYFFSGEDSVTTTPAAAPAPAPAPKPIAIEPEKKKRLTPSEMGKLGAAARKAKRLANPPAGTPAEALKNLQPGS